MVKPSVLTEARILTDSDAGKTYFLNAAGGFSVTLPTPRAGIGFEFIVKTAPTTDYVIETAADAKIFYGKVFTSDTNAALDATTEIGGASKILLEANTAKVGDSIEVLSDGTYWYVNGYCSIYNAIQIAEQSKSPSVSTSRSPSRSPSTSLSRSPSRSPSASPS